MNLSKSFTLAELTKSQTATRLGIDNTPTPEQLENLVELCHKVLQPLRDAVGPVLISSGLRVPALNKAIGGSATSQHCAINGAAADIDVKDNRKVFDYIKDNLQFDQLIWEFGDRESPDWVHVSYHYGKNRGQVLRAIKKNAKTTYINYK
tara:strand:+ start:533 stop:982 length:450 start_codon:yes stop_codon:yes gene_type:complete